MRETILLLHVVGFCIGSIPTGYIIARAKGIDIRRHGSGNVGATNVGRTIGKSAGLITLLLDVAKGAIAASLAFMVQAEHSQILVASVGFCAILGHCFSPFLRFRGGKGVATSLGVFIIVSPLAACVAIISFIAVMGCTGYVSLGSIVAACTVPITVVLTSTLGEKSPDAYMLVLLSIASAALITIKHRSNISRLRKGEESRYVFSKPPGTK